MLYLQFEFVINLGADFSALFNINGPIAAHNIIEVMNMRPKDKRLTNIMPIPPLDLPDAKDRADIDKDGFKPDSHKVKLGPGSKR